MSVSHLDVAVVGAGVAGALAATLLSGRGLRTALIDLREPQPIDPAGPIDPRVVAVSPGSARALTAAGAWQRLDPGRLGPYDRMEVHAGAGRLRFVAAEHGLEQLGWIAELPALAHALWTELKTRSDVDQMAPARIDAVAFEDDGIKIKLVGGALLKAAIVVAADGARSQLRKWAGMATRTWHYNQSALITHLETDRRNPGIAWQRFTDSGPMALLPLPGGRSSLVWSTHASHAAELEAMPSDAFLEALGKAAIEPPFGRFRSHSRRYAIGLVRRQSETLARGRLVLLGDAARSVHPLAGQGLNLGVADAVGLAAVLSDWDPTDDPGTRLARYSRRRQSDGGLIAGGIHGINESAWVGGAASRAAMALSFGAVQRLWPLRDAFVRRACGLDIEP